MTSIVPKGSHYVPAIGDNIITKWTNGFRWQDKTLRFFERNQSFFYHPFSLMSAYYTVHNKEATRTNIGMPNDTILIGDSGGFQVLSFGKKGRQIDVTPTQILRWLEANVDIGMNLDSPPDYDHFNDSLKFSVENFDYFEKNRLRYGDFKLYNVLHGNNLEHIDLWYNSVKRFNFDGWALGIHPSTNIYLKLIAYLYLHEAGETSHLNSCHFFGVSGPTNMISLAMLSKHFDASLTFDSSSWSWGQRFRDYWFSNDIRHCVRLGRLFKNSMSGVPCDCPICKTLSLDMLYNQSDSITPFLLSFHNMYNYINTNRNINIMSDDYEVLQEYARSIGEEDVFHNTNNIIESYERFGIEKTYNKFKQLFSNRPKTISETNLFSFT